MINNKNIRIAAVFTVLLVLGLILIMIGPRNDAETIALTRKAGVLTAETIDVSFEKVSAKLINRPVIESQQVKKGEILMQLDRTDTLLAIETVKASIQQNDASIEKAKAQLEVSEKQYKRALTLSRSGAGSESNLDECLSAFRVAQASLKELQANAKSLHCELDKLLLEDQRLTLRAPEDGKILELLYEPGEVVPMGSPAVILETNRKYFDIYVNEMQANNFQAGSSVIGYAVAIKENIPGTVRIVTAAPSFADLRMTRERGTADLTSFKVRIYVDNVDRLLTGMTIEVDND